MLAAWMRMKYPSKIYAALAASAPVRWYLDTVDPNGFNEISRAVISNQVNGEQCIKLLDQGISDLRNL